MHSQTLPRITLRVAPLLYFTMAAAQTVGPDLKWKQPALPALPPARCCAPMVRDPATGGTLLYGGGNYNVAFNDTWSFSKATGWIQLSPATSPTPVSSASMAYDPTTNTAVLFGGILGNQVGSSNSNQTWTWDGVNWTRQFPPVSPSARGWNVSGMVFDSKLGKVVMFGGYTAQFVYNSETWEWDGTTKTWSQQFPAHSPSPRAAPLAYDPAANEVVLYGGFGSALPYYYGDTWTYDGLDWVQRHPSTSPGSRNDVGLAFDPLLKGVVLFGGLAGNCEDCGQGRLNDTWLWNGDNWSQLQTSSPPHASSGVSFAYDSTTQAMVLFGGWVTDFQFAKATWFFN